MNTKSRIGIRVLTLLCLICAGSGVSQGAIMLEIDISDPSAVVITSTGEFSLIAGTSSPSHFPIKLKNFFTSDPGTTTYSDGSSTLQGPAGVSYNSIFGGRSAPGQTTAILRRDSGAAETFTASDAFSGTATFDLSSISGLLQSGGFIGNITLDNAGGDVIGTYQISAVPEPAAYGLATGIALAVFAVRRKRLTAASK